MSSETSDVWGVPGWAASSITGPNPVVPQRDPRRPRTLSVVEPPVPTTHLGPVKRGSPPPDLARVASSFALLGALLLALVLSWALGG